MANSVYGELFEQLPIPERLSPENIAKMLDEHMEANTNRGRIAVSDSSVTERKIDITHSTAYRVIMSVAACAVLVLGLISYTADKPTVVTEPPAAGNYAQDYDEIHKTFQKFYVDEENKTTLDSAIAEIEHSYNEAEHNSQTDEVKEPEITVGTADAEIPDVPASDAIPPVDEAPEIEEVPDEEEEEIITEIPDSHVVLPNIDGFDNNHGIYAEGSRIFVRDGDSIRVFNTLGTFTHEAVLTAQINEGETKTLADFFVIGDKVALVYDVESSQTVTYSETELPEDATLDDILGEAYTETEETVTRHSAEVRIYQLTPSGAFEVYNQSQAGKLIGAVEANGSVYMVTDYNDYRLAPIVGVEDLASYVPTYSVMGEQRYIEAGNILLPSKITTTDYTVISGINTATLVGNVQALLGYEGRVIATGEAVYIFGYETDAVLGGTSVEIFALADGIVSHKGFTMIDGLALSGDGITLCGDTILVSTVCGTDTTCTTTVRAYDSSLEIISKVDFPGLFTNVHRDGTKLYYGNEYGAYGVDFADPTAPVLVEATGIKNVTDYLVEFEDGYLTLVENEGSLVLSKVIEDANGNIAVCAETVVYSGTFTSKALANNGILFTSGSLVGVPYGYFDGLDYCYTYALYKSTATGFELVGTFEAHETDAAFEFGKAVEHEGIVYLFSDGRVYSLTANESVLAYNSRVDLIYSTYSGHNGF